MTVVNIAAYRSYRSRARQPVQMTRHYSCILLPQPLAVTKNPFRLHRVDYEYRLEARYRRVFINITDTDRVVLFVRTRRLCYR